MGPLTYKDAFNAATSGAERIAVYYGLNPAALKVRRRVKFRGQPGVITGLCRDGGMTVHVKLDGAKRSVPCHPEWRMDYLDGRGEIAS